MHRITTPIHTYILPIQTSECDEIEVTYKQKCLIKTFLYDGTLPDGMTLDGKNVIIKLTQEQTKALKSAYDLTSQVRVRTNDGNVLASQIFDIKVDEVLSEEILNG